jgi:hypothetical protein
MRPTSNTRRTYLLLVLVSLLFVFGHLLASLPIAPARNNAVSQSLVNGASLPATASSLPPLQKTVLVGVLTIPSKTAIRQVIRSSFRAYSAELRQKASLYFVVGQPRTAADAEIVNSEQTEFGDMLALGCAENMNAGKTYEFFVAAEAVRPRHSHYLKADDDAFVHVPNLVDTLSRYPDDALVYYGRHCAKAQTSFMCGMAYSLSASLFAQIPRPPFRVAGHEDQVTDTWIRRHVEARGLSVARVSDDRFYDWEFATVDSGDWKHAFAPGNQTVVVHQLKSPEAYHSAVTFFQRSR